MKPLLESVSRERGAREEQMLDREDLISQKHRIDEKIKRFERKDIDDKIIGSLRKLEDVTDAVSDLQGSLNIVWKRIRQIEEELKEALSMPRNENKHP